MSAPNMVAASTRLLHRFPNLLAARLPEPPWDALVAELQQELEFEAAWLDLESPVASTFWLGSPNGEQIISSGELLAKARRAPEGWVFKPAPSACYFAVHLQSAEVALEGGLVLAFAACDGAAVEGWSLLAAVLGTVFRDLFCHRERQTAGERLGRFEHLYEVAQAIGSTLDLDQVLQQSAARVTEALHAEASTLFLIDETRRELVFKTPAGPAEELLREQRMPIDMGVVGWAATHGETVTIPDVESDLRFYTGIDRLTGYRTRSILAAPIKVKGHIIGVIEVVNKIHGAFTVDDQRWLNILAPLIGVAVENARLYIALQEERDRIIAAEEEVRHELARSLHDGPAQTMAAIILNIDMARRYLATTPESMATELDFLENLAREANQEVRDLLFNLRPLTLETHGLVTAITQLAARIQAHAPYNVRLDLDVPCEEDLDPKVGGTLFVIIQEALNNIHKHARAQNVSIKLGVANDVLWIEVVDDGIGFDVKQVTECYDQMDSFGLLNVRERARLIDGRVGITSPPPWHDSGTMVRVEVPWRRACRRA